MKTESLQARLALVERQRRFEWTLAHDEQALAARQLVAGHTHDLLNMVQIVDLAAFQFGRRSGPEVAEFVEELRRVVDHAKRSMKAIVAAADVEGRPRGALVGPAVHAAVEAARTAVAITATIEVGAQTATACTQEELAQIVIGLALDADDPTLLVRERTIDGAPWLEIVGGPTRADEFTLRVLGAIAVRGTGECTQSERRGGGNEIVIALPIRG